ncbi:hypothetical protein CONPUDRAFT_44275, partial [Coniophora puteana RWD-64-598 SS2]
MNTTPVTNQRLRILQLNMNNSRYAHDDLLNGKLADDWDVVVLQEPCLDRVGNTRATASWRVVYP